MWGVANCSKSPKYYKSLYGCTATIVLMKFFCEKVLEKILKKIVQKFFYTWRGEPFRWGYGSLGSRFDWFEWFVGWFEWFEARTTQLEPLEPKTPTFHSGSRGSSTPRTTQRKLFSSTKKIFARKIFFQKKFVLWGGSGT